jgi:hypothetical protein
VQDTKLTFSSEEMRVLKDSHFFLTKHEVTQKILLLFGMLEKELMKKIPEFSFLSLELKIKDKGKIFRGENYRLLPYILLDCPRVFTTETVFSFRSMFWWGNEFSFTLHLQGKALEIFRKKILEKIHTLANQQFFLCVNDTPWQYSFEKENYMMLDEMIQNDPGGLNNLLETKSFLKLSRKMELSQYQNTAQFGVDTFEKLMEVLR